MHYTRNKVTIFYKVILNDWYNVLLQARLWSLKLKKSKTKPINLREETDILLTLEHFFIEFIFEFDSLWDTAWYQIINSRATMIYYSVFTHRAQTSKEICSQFIYMGTCCKTCGWFLIHKSKIIKNLASEYLLSFTIFWLEDTATIFLTCILVSLQH